jgi:SAM-dependent methyltransferase
MGNGALDPEIRLEDLLRPDVDYSRPPGGGEGLFDLIGDLRGKRVLDLGCGHAPYRPAIEGRGATWIGLDLGGPRCSVHGSGTELPFANGSFDGVLCAAVLQLIPNVDRVLAEVHRVLVPGGVFFGYTAFLEHFHAMSYHHLSHLGLDHLLRQHGFQPRRIFPSAVLAPAYQMQYMLLPRPVPIVQPLLRAVLQFACTAALCANRLLRDLLFLAQRLPSEERRRLREQYAQLLALKFTVGFNFVAERIERPAEERRDGYLALTSRRASVR